MFALPCHEIHPAVRRAPCGCASIERLRWSRRHPPLAKIDNPTTQAGYKPADADARARTRGVSAELVVADGIARLLRTSALHQVGDILTVKVKFTDKASLENETRKEPQERRGFRDR